MTRTYRSRYVHKISPRDTDTGPDVTLDADTLPRRYPDAVGMSRRLLDCKTVGSILRQSRVLGKGESVYEARLNSDGTIVAFPRASIWHSIILTPSV